MPSLTYNERNGQIVNDHGYQVRFKFKEDAEKYMGEDNNNKLDLIQILRDILKSIQLNRGIQMNIKEAADMLGRDTSNIRKMCRDGRLPNATKKVEGGDEIRKSWNIPESDVQSVKDQLKSSGMKRYRLSKDNVYTSQWGVKS